MFGLIPAGLANFSPDRRTNEAVFGGSDSLGWIVIGVRHCGLDRSCTGRAQHVGAKARRTGQVGVRQQSSNFADFALEVAATLR